MLVCVLHSGCRPALTSLSSVEARGRSIKNGAAAAGTELCSVSCVHGMQMPAQEHCPFGQSNPCTLVPLAPYLWPQSGKQHLGETTALVPSC